MNVDNTCPQRGNRYKTKEESHTAFLNAKRTYANKMWICNTCGFKINRGNKTQHLRSKKHLENEKRREESLTCSSDSCGGESISE